MVGQRIRSGPQAAPTTPTKRPLTELLGSSKPAVDAVITKKARLADASSAPLQRQSAQKENQQLAGERPDVLQVKSEADVAVQATATLLTPVSTSTKPHHALEPTASPAGASTSSTSSIPHVYAHAHLLLSSSSPLTSSLHLSGRSYQHETLLAFLSRRFPAVYAPASPDAPSRTDPSPSTPSRPGSPAMYVSGQPGIGKTALISSLLAEFGRNVGERDLVDEVRFCMENCSTVGAGEAAWERLGRALGIEMERRGKLKAKEVFEAGLKDGKKYLLVLDEIDHLCDPTSPASRSASASPDLLKSLCALASLPSSPLTLIGIANDHTFKLPVPPTLSPALALDKGKGKAKVDPLNTPKAPLRLQFEPYKWQELVEIVSQRLALLAPVYPITFDEAVSLAPSSADRVPFPLIDKVALSHCAKKVAQPTGANACSSGDARTMLNAVRKALSIAASSVSTASSSLSPVDLATLTPSTAPKATMQHMTAALKTSVGLTTGPTLATRLSLLQDGPYHRPALVSFVIALSRSPELPLGLSTTDAVTPSRIAIAMDEAFRVYKELTAREAALERVQLDPNAFAETLAAIEDTGGFVEVHLAGGAGSSPSKRRRGKQSPSRKNASNTSATTVRLSTSAPFDELVAALLAPATTPTEDEPRRLSRRLLEREQVAQSWKRKRAELGRDEERRAEDELAARDWERRVKALGKGDQAE
ncbi:hypothetical protein JCM1841_007057 [Sporobolomyces salmonicolor]